MRKAKMVLGTIVNPDFIEAYRKLLIASVSIGTAFKLKSITRKLTEDQTNYHQLKVELLTKYGDKDEEGNLITKNDIVQFSSGNSEIFSSKLKELQSTEVEYDVILCSELKDVSITTEELLLLDSLIVE